MRIASVLHDVSPEPDGAPLLPAVALERDGALYRVSELARAFGPRYAALAEDPAFQHTIVALRAEPLYELDERLKSGDRPSSARILPGSFTWLPPCDPERASLFFCGPCAAGGAAAPNEPSFRIGSARALSGHEATIPLLGEEGALCAGGSLAVMIGDDLWRATAEEAEQAILGYTALLEWSAGPSSAAAQLGPALVTRDEAASVGALRTQVRVDSSPRGAGQTAAWAFPPAESIAWLSHHVPLRAGDVISADGGRGGASGALPFGARVDFAVERLGRLSGRAARGPAMRAWRRSAR